MSANTFFVHKIHLQLKLYHCNALLSTYIQQNNQKAEKPPPKFTNKIVFLVGDVTFPIFDVLFKIQKFPNGISHIWRHRTVFPIGKFGISVIPTTVEHHKISTEKSPFKLNLILEHFLFLFFLFLFCIFW